MEEEQTALDFFAGGVPVEGQEVVPVSERLMGGL
jgi:hypothetical protein